MDARRPSFALNRNRSGFTLIEVLVVVAIIALLVAILIPSLAAARTESRIVACQANAKQLGTMMSAYLAEHGGALPIIINWHANGAFGTPPQNTWLSVALRKYWHGRSPIPKQYDPVATGAWSEDKRLEYEAKVMPPSFGCPFQDNEPKAAVEGPIIKGYRTYQMSGRWESWHTWLWEDIVAGEPMEGKTPKYSVLTWNRVCASNAPVPMPDCVTLSVASAGDPDSEVLTRFRKWTIGDAKRVRAGSFGKVTVVYCSQGEHLELDRRRWNINSHRRGDIGGSNAVFADTHVEWVRGDQIGWP